MEVQEVNQVLIDETFPNNSFKYSLISLQNYSKEELIKMLQAEVKKTRLLQVQLEESE